MNQALIKIKPTCSRYFENWLHKKIYEHPVYNCYINFLVKIFTSNDIYDNCVLTFCHRLLLVSFFAACLIDSSSIFLVAVVHFLIRLDMYKSFLNFVQRSQTSFRRNSLKFGVKCRYGLPIFIKRFDLEQNNLC